MIGLLLACGSGADTAVAPGCEDAYDVTWESWGEGFFTTYCRSCHSASTSTRLGAPEGVNFDTSADLVQWSEAIRLVVLEEQTMPVGGGVYAEDLLLLEMLLECGQ